MELVLERDSYTTVSTQGKISSVGIFLCETLEMPRKNGLPGSCIPEGRFVLELGPSPKFLVSQDAWVKQYADMMPHVVNIPQRSLIMIHWGNVVENTDGCILVGKTRGVNEIFQSREAFADLYDMIYKADNVSAVYLTVKSAVEAPQASTDPELSTT